MITDRAWQEMLDEFRVLGGTAENVRLGYGAFGRGIFPVDPAKPVVIRIPDSMLVPLDHVTFDNDVFRVSDASWISERGRNFLEQYERDFAWGTGARAEIETVLAGMQALPENLRERLAKNFLDNLPQPVIPELVQKVFLRTRAISSGDRPVVMPIIELANHGGSARYDTTWGVSLQGQFEGEVLVRYSVPADPYGVFSSWLFPSQEPLAFSIPITYNMGGRELRIGRAFEEDEPAPWIPKISVTGNTVSLNYMLLGHQQFPRVPRAAFYKALANAGLEPQNEAFEAIQHANRQLFLDLIGELEGIDSPAVRPLRTMARYQLNALSSYFGIRQV